jgi:hypothetical protein
LSWSLHSSQCSFTIPTIFSNSSSLSVNSTMSSAKSKTVTLSSPNSQPPPPFFAFWSISLMKMLKSSSDSECPVPFSSRVLPSKHYHTLSLSQWNRDKCLSVSPTSLKRNGPTCTHDLGILNPAPWLSFLGRPSSFLRLVSMMTHTPTSAQL